MFPVIDREIWVIGTIASTVANSALTRLGSNAKRYVGRQKSEPSRRSFFAQTHFLRYNGYGSQSAYLRLVGLKKAWGQWDES